MSSQNAVSTQFAHAREYLAKVLPWPQAGDSAPSYINIHWTVKSPGYDKATWRGTPCQSVDEAVKAIEYALKKPDTRDIYACMSSQASFAERAGAKGKFRTAVRSQQGAVALKSLFIDLDAKGTDKNSYATLNEAVAALGEFLKAADMPKPSLVVASGGGLHVYWTLTRALQPHEWQPFARALAEATKLHGLKCDTQCTIDSARVLRVPDTFNNKLDQPRKVRLAGPRADFDYSIERIERALVPYKTITPPHVNGFDPTLFPRRPAIQGVSELAAGIEPAKAPPVNLDSVALECGFIGDALATGGKDISNPLWNLTTLISTFTEGARADAHRMGDKHTGYTVESTDEFFDRKSREKDEKGLGWPSCKAISATGAIQCQKCKHFTTQRSPLNFGSRTLTATSHQPAIVPQTTANSLATASSGSSAGATSPPPTQSDLPSGYVRGLNGVISALILQDDGTSKPVPICEYRMDEPWLQSAPNTLHFTSTIERGKTQQISLETEYVNSMDMRKMLQVQGLMLPVGPKGMENVARFFVSWIKQLQESRDSVTSSPFGWSVKNGKEEGFVYAGRLWTPKGDSAAASADTVTGKHYQPTGELAPWTAAAELITAQCRPDLEALLASAFAAPLVRFTGQPGVLLSAYSTESGIGKSTVLKIAQAVWGDPIRAVQSLSDTQNSVMNKLGEIKSLPLYWDELKTEEDTKKFVNIVFQTTQGKEKSRMRSNVTQREPGSWQTLLVSASNDSLLDYVTAQTNSTTAGLYRIFQYVVKPAVSDGPGQIEPSEATHVVAKVHDNYGQVGLAYAKFLGANFAAIENDVHDYSKELGTEVKTTPDERFWIALISVICLGARYANKLGFTKFNEEALKSFMLEVLVDMRKVRIEQPADMDKAINVSTRFGQFLTAMSGRHTLFTNLIHAAHGKPASNSIQVDFKRCDIKRLDGIYVQVGVSDKRMRFSSTYFNRWLSQHGFPQRVFTDALIRQFGMCTVRGRLGAGTDHQGGALEYLFEIDLANPAAAGFFDA